LRPQPLELDLGPANAAVERRLARWDDERFARRLWERDATLWGAASERQQVARERLGWLTAPAAMRSETPLLRAFATEIESEGFTHAVLLGMGGSSLAPEVLSLTLGGRTRGLELAILDNTSPTAVRSILDQHDPRRTFFLVASKSGGTIEVNAFERACFEWVRAVRSSDAGRAFCAITDPGTPLARHAAERGYRRVFLNAADIGGRYSALSFFGLVPAALLGADLDGLLDGALEEEEASRDAPARTIAGLQLGAALGELALAGRDKVTLVLAPQLAALGSWIEQLVAESTGKEGRGLIPVDGEELGAPEVYGSDRVFVAVGLEAHEPSTAARLEALRKAKHPVVRWALPGIGALGGEFLRWEIATAAAAAVLDVNPFDEPNVAEAKLATQQVLERRLHSSKEREHPPPVHAGRLEVHLPPSQPGARFVDAAGMELSHAGPLFGADPRGTRPGDYVGLLAWMHRTPDRRRALEQLRVAIRHDRRVATTLGFGPRYLHSTGQLHKGGPNNGIFLQLTCDEPELPIPGERYGFHDLQRAQARGDYDVLARRGRRVARIHLGSNVEEGVAALVEALTTTRRR
jgi:glucose-6-phosphate isomerase